MPRSGAAAAACRAEGRGAAGPSLLPEVFVGALELGDGVDGSLGTAAAVHDRAADGPVGARDGCKAASATEATRDGACRLARTLHWVIAHREAPSARHESGTQRTSRWLHLQTARSRQRGETQTPVAGRRKGLRSLQRERKTWKPVADTPSSQRASHNRESAQPEPRHCTLRRAHKTAWPALRPKTVGKSGAGKDALDV